MVSKRRTSGRLIAFLAVAVTAALAASVVPAMASANAPEYFQNGAPVPDEAHIGFTSKAISGVQVWERVDGQRFDCADLTSASAISGPKEGETTVTFTGCTGLGFECHSAGAAKGEVIVHADSHLVIGVHDGGEEVVSELLFPTTEEFPPREPEEVTGGEPPDTMAEFICFGGLVQFVWRGSMLGSIEPVGEESNTSTLTFSQAGGVQQSGTEYVDDEGNRHVAYLEWSINGDEFQQFAWKPKTGSPSKTEKKSKLRNPDHSRESRADAGHRPAPRPARDRENELATGRGAVENA